MTIRSLTASLRPLVPAALLLAGGAGVSTASAQSSAIVAPTVITSVPITITASGKYILGNDVTNSAGGAAITISVANVSLDLGGYFVSGSGDTGSSNPVISVGDVAGVVIKNGTLANEGLGIEFTGSSDPRDYAVEGVTFTHCYISGVTFDNQAIAGKVYGCKFSDLGGSSVAETLLTAITSNGGVRAEKNTIDTLTSSDGALTFGIAAMAGDFIVGNTIASCNFGAGFGVFLNNLTTNISEEAFVEGVNATGNTSVETDGTVTGGKKNAAFTRGAKYHKR